MSNRKNPLYGAAFALLLTIFGLHNSPYAFFKDAAAAPVSKTFATNEYDSSVDQRKDVLIHFHAGVSLAQRQAYIDSISGELLLWIEQLHVAKVSVPNEFTLTDGLIGGTSDEATVETVEADGLVYGTFEPNDPDLYDTQRMYAPELLGLFDAWDYTTGIPEVVVSVLDTGIASAHPEFAGRILDGYDYYNNDSDPEDDHGHGTHVAGTVGATVNNGIGGAGLCGNCSILPVKVLNQNNAGTWSGVAAGIIFAADNDADIIVMSLGSTSGTQVVKDAIDYALSKDVLIIAAAGNANSSRDFYPAAYEGVVGVAASDRDDERWVLSNYGSYVDISAPGHVVYSTYNDLNNSYDGHVFMSGTSMATPHVGGLAGLIKSQDPSRTSAEVTEILLNSALDLGEPGRDDYFGEGRIDPVAALAYDAPEPKTAVLGGTVWYDENADSYFDSTEQERVADVTITLYSSTNQVVGSATSSTNGSWQISNLASGAYRIAVEPGDAELIWTNPNHAETTLEAGQQYLNRSIGFVGELPPESVTSGVSINRQGTEVVLTWEMTSELVTGLTLERSIDESDYQVIEEFDLAASVTARSIQNFSDTLPEGTADAVVSYRMQISPGGNYLDTIPVTNTDSPEPGTATPPTTTQPPPSNDTTLFLPWIASQQFSSQ